MDYINYPNIYLTSDSINGIPVDIQHAVLVSTAIKALQYLIMRIEHPKPSEVKISEDSKNEDKKLKAAKKKEATKG